MSLSHRMTKTSTYRVWSGMKARCYTPSAAGYANYGGRGIRVCTRWHKFENFLADMGERPEGMSLDRINGNGDYTPANCRWATRLEQNRNQSDLVFLTLDGETHCLSAWAERYWMSESTLRARLRRGWDTRRAITTPVRAHKQYERRAV